VTTIEKKTFERWACGRKAEETGEESPNRECARRSRIKQRKHSRRRHQGAKKKSPGGRYKGIYLERGREKGGSGGEGTSSPEKKGVSGKLSSQGLGGGKDYVGPAVFPDEGRDQGQSKRFDVSRKCSKPQRQHQKKKKKKGRTQRKRHILLPPLERGGHSADGSHGKGNLVYGGVL